jgi:hypothetical protein
MLDVTAQTVDGRTTVSITDAQDKTRQATYERQGAEALAEALESPPVHMSPADFVPALNLSDADCEPLARDIREAIAASDRAPRRRWH